MKSHQRDYEIRCPVHGFVRLNDWEREIVSQPAFQRLRRVRQLAWTDYVYPGAMHTRFEHSLGVMHTASLLFDALVGRSLAVLQDELGYNEAGLERHRQLVRLAALLHDVGHGPFSHAAEELMPEQGGGAGKYVHEQYSAVVIRTKFGQVIRDHPLNKNYCFTPDEIASLIEGGSSPAAFWREVISGQIDADRIDYLQRDSLHAGVQYGRFDQHRLIGTVAAIPFPEGQAPRIGVSEGGWHAAESLVLARYFMFTQVYFHKTRVAFDLHLREALKTMLPGGCFPAAEADRVDEYLAWDDWRVLGKLANGEGGEHGQRLASRNHFREVYHTPETPSEDDWKELDSVREALGDLVASEESADKSWYKTGPPDIVVESETGRVDRLSAHSSIVKSLLPNRQRLLYVRPKDCDEARRRRQSVLGRTTHAV